MDLGRRNADQDEGTDLGKLQAIQAIASGGQFEAGSEATGHAALRYRHRQAAIAEDEGGIDQVGGKGLAQEACTCRSNARSIRGGRPVTRPWMR